MPHLDTAQPAGRPAARSRVRRARAPGCASTLTPPAAWISAIASLGSERGPRHVAPRPACRESAGTRRPGRPTWPAAHQRVGHVRSSHHARAVRAREHRVTIDGRTQLARSRSMMASARSIRSLAEARQPRRQPGVRRDRCSSRGCAGRRRCARVDTSMPGTTSSRRRAPRPARAAAPLDRVVVGDRERDQRALARRARPAPRASARRR